MDGSKGKSARHFLSAIRMICRYGISDRFPADEAMEKRAGRSPNTASTEHPAAKAPPLLHALRRAEPDYVPVDGTIAECDGVGDGRADYSGKARCRGVNIQATTDPSGQLIWYSPVLPGRNVDVTAVRAHRIVPRRRTTRGEERPAPRHGAPSPAALGAALLDASGGGPAAR